MVVVDRQAWIAQVARERRPAIQAVVDRLRGRRSVGDLDSLQDEPVVQRLGDRCASFLSMLQPALVVEVTDVALDLVELADPLHRRARDRALVGRVQLDELAPGVSHAADLGDAALEQRLVSAVVVAHQMPDPGLLTWRSSRRVMPEERPRMLAGAARRKVVHHGLDRLGHGGGICPQVRALRLARARREHRHRRFVGMQDLAVQQFGLERVGQRLEPRAALAHPRRERRAGDRHPGTAKDRFLPIQRQVIGVLGHQHVGQQPRRRDALVDDVRGHRRLHEHLALHARPFSPNVAFHRKDARRVVELLGDVLAHALHRAAAGAVRVLGVVGDLAPRQCRGQRRAPGRLLRFVGLRRKHGLEFGQLLVDRRDVGVDRLVEQQPLLGAHPLTGTVELQPPQLRQLEGEFADLGVAPGDLLGVATSAIEQGLREFAQLLDIEFIELVRIEVREVDRHRRPVSHWPIIGTIGASGNGRELHQRDGSGLTDALPRQSEHECVELLARERLRRAVAAPWPDEAALVQPPCREPDTDPVVHQHLEPGRTLVGEHVRMMRSRGAEHLDDTRERRVGSGSHVHRLHAQPDRVDTDHRSQSRSHAAQSRAADAGHVMHIVVPARCNSMRISPWTVAAGNANGTNVGGPDGASSACAATGTGRLGASLCSASSTHLRSMFALSP